MADALLLDTHALLWWQAGGRKLSKRASAAIENAGAILLCPITFWEVAMLSTKGRIVLDRAPVRWVNDLLANERIEATELSATIAASAGVLPEFHGDPADRLIFATAQALGSPIITKDSGIRDYARAHGGAATVW
jgi:PIN domain nuclease of toxin-antitoxin system